MTSEQWVDENPVMTPTQFAAFMKNHQFDNEFKQECEAYRCEGGYVSSEVFGAAGY